MIKQSFLVILVFKKEYIILSGMIYYMSSSLVQDLHILLTPVSFTSSTMCVRVLILGIMLQCFYLTCKKHSPLLLQRSKGVMATFILRSSLHLSLLTPFDSGNYKKRR